MTAERVDPAFPLARETDRNMSLEAWRKFAQSRVAPSADHTDPPGVLLAMRNEYIRGLAAFEIRETPDSPRSLLVDRAIIIDRTREHVLSRELLGGLLNIAEQEGCARVCAELPQSSGWLHKRWSDPHGDVFRLPVICMIRPATPSRHAPPADTGIVNFRARS